MPTDNQLLIIPERVTGVVSMAYVIVLASAGFITNFFPIFTTNTGTVLLYALASFLSAAGLLYLFGSINKQLAVPVCLLLLISALGLLKAVLDGNPVSERAPEFLIFLFGAWPFFFFVQIRSSEIRRRIVAALSIGFLGLSVFAIFQSLFATSLPESLFILRGDKYFDVFNPEDVNIMRPTGLTGNPIIFASILVLASAHFAALWFERRKRKYLLALLCSLVANYLTYTRATIILVIPVLLCVWLFHRRFRIKHKLTLLIGLAIVAATGQYLIVRGANNLMIQRVLNLDPTSIASTIDHFQQVNRAIDEMASHPLAGVGFGSQGNSGDPNNIIVTDGAWWIMLLEFGIPLSLLILLSLGLVLTNLLGFVLRQDSEEREIAIATLSFHAYIIPASFINSGLLGHISFGFYWVMLGLSLSSISLNSKAGTSSSPARTRPPVELVISLRDPSNVE